jgi:hypothetical protein
VEQKVPTIREASTQTFESAVSSLWRREHILAGKPAVNGATKSADGRIATEAAWLNRNRLTEMKK